MQHYANGTRVVTRSGKRGEVVRGTGATILVRFGSREFEMSPTSVIRASAYDAMGRGYSPQRHV